MLSALDYPDLLPPEGWTYVQQGTQIRLLPPGSTAAQPEAAIVIAPLLGKHERLPPLPKLIELALDTECQVRFTLRERGAPQPLTSDTGLRGVSQEVSGYARPDGPPERRIYVLYGDDQCVYGISYLAREDAFARHLDTFWAAARSLRPFTGRVLSPPQIDPTEPSPVGHYGE
jgi:hypothetical protein